MRAAAKSGLSSSTAGLLFITKFSADTARACFAPGLLSWARVSTDLLFTLMYLAPQPLLVDLSLGSDFLLIILMSSFVEISFYYCLGWFVLLLING